MLSHIPCGDLDFNLAHPSGTPTLVPSCGLEQRLDFRCHTADHNTPSPATEPLRLAVHLHVYYLEALDALLGQLNHCSAGLGRFDLWISTDSSAKASTIRLQVEATGLSQMERLEIRVVANRGRNLGPLLVDLWPELRGYGLLLHLHGKQSVETSLGPAWFQDLLRTLLPDAGTVQQLREHWAHEPSLGLMMPQPPELLRPYLNWGNNFEAAQQLALNWDRPALSRDAVLLFPAGMMFWCQPAALEPLAQLLQGLPELPPEPLPVDGTSLHALERLVGHSCEVAGLEWRLITQKQTSPRPPATTVSLWQHQREAFQQATALLAARARQQAEELACCQQNFASCQEQLQALIVDSDLQLKAAAGRLEQLERSWSWRLTAPLRNLRR
jgi:lipopolysaccharide biosynthesis protein